jgi:DNA-binding response OmpR family regulator
MSSPSRYVDDSAPAQPRVLLVDDEPVTLMVTSAALREHGFLVREASGGQEALDLVTESVPDIVVLDARMPGLDGFETCRSLRARPGFENLPVLMLTGLDDDASITRAYQAGATDFFVKSNQWSLLDGRLRYLLRASRTRQELERSKRQAGARAGSGAHGQLRLAAPGRLSLSAEALRVFGRSAADRLGMREVLRMVPPEERLVMLRMLRRRCSGRRC